MFKQRPQEVKIVNSKSFPLLGILGLIFITLKLTGHITWSWWWVLAPFWIPIAALLAIFIFVFVFMVIAKK